MTIDTTPAAPPPTRRRTRRPNPTRLHGRWRHLPALLIATGFVLPLVFMVSGSLRKTGLPPPRTPELVPDPVALDNHPRAFELVDIPRYTLNSLLVVAAAVPLTLLFASWAGFAMSRLSRRAAGMLVALSLITLMVPLTALLVSRFAIFRILRLTDTYVPLIAPSLLGTTPFYVLLFYWSFRRLPTELFEACRLEGMGPVATWRRVAMPLVRPVTVAVAVLTFVFTWSNLKAERSNDGLLGSHLTAVMEHDLFRGPLLLAGRSGCRLAGGDLGG